MRIYLIRHADAIAQNGLEDEHRFLSEAGRRAARAVGERLKAEGVELDALLSSPLVRAVQTAELLAEALAFTGTIEILPALAPGYPPRIAAEELPSRGVSVGVVGHEPNIAGLGAFLLHRPAFPPFRKCQVSLIEDGKPIWTLNPDTLAIDRLLVA